MHRTLFSPRGTSVLCALALLPFAAACDGDDDGLGTSGDAAVQIQVTDLPSDDLRGAEVWISQVYLQGGPGHAADTTDVGSKGRVYLFDDDDHPLHLDLLALRDGVVANLTDTVMVDAGAYKQLRIVVDSAKVTLREGLQFEDGSATAALRIPSGSSSGVKVQLGGDIETEDDAVTRLLVDFDVNQNFVVQLKTVTIVKGVTFTPVIHEKSRNTTEL